MPVIILTIASWLGISPFRLIAYAAIVAAVIVGAITIRQHYINLGYHNAIVAVKKQDDKAKVAAEKVERKANECTDNSYWDVISQNCHLSEVE
jgi:hypothetical protein